MAIGRVIPGVLAGQTGNIQGRKPVPIFIQHGDPTVSQQSVLQLHSTTSQGDAQDSKSLKQTHLTLNKTHISFWWTCFPHTFASNPTLILPAVLSTYIPAAILSTAFILPDSY